MSWWNVKQLLYFCADLNLFNLQNIRSSARFNVTHIHITNSSTQNRSRTPPSRKVRSISGLINGRKSCRLIKINTIVTHKTSAFISVLMDLSCSNSTNAIVCVCENFALCHKRRLHLYALHNDGKSKSHFFTFACYYIAMYRLSVCVCCIKR